MGGIFRNQRCASLIVNGTEDHVHILAHVRPSIAVSDLLREVKASSSEYMHREKRLAGFAWQEGYSAISVRGDDFENERRYIERQAEHHKKERYEFELRRILTTNGIEYDEKYLLG
jgi:REP element-mobilizing transposase RayT